MGASPDDNSRSVLWGPLFHVGARHLGTGGITTVLMGWTFMPAG